MKKRWLIRHYRHLPRGARRILADGRTSNNLAVVKRARQRYRWVYAIAARAEDLLMKGHRSREALHLWRQTVRRFPRTPDPFFRRADWAMRRQHDKEARKFLRLGAALPETAGISAKRRGVGEQRPCSNLLARTAPR